MPTEAEPRVMGPQAKEGPEKGQQSPKDGRGKKEIISQSLCREPSPTPPHERIKTLRP